MRLDAVAERSRKAEPPHATELEASTYGKSAPEGAIHCRRVTVYSHRTYLLLQRDVLPRQLAHAVVALVE